VKSYLEITWLVNAVILYVCFDLSSKMTNISLDKRRCMIACLFHVVVSERADSILMFVLIAAAISLFLFQRHLSAICECWFLYAVSVCLLQFLDGIELYRGMIYTHAESLNGIFVSLLWLAFDVSGNCFFSVFTKAELYVPVLIQTAYDTFECTGFLDTGNQAMSENLPVVFVKRKLKCTDKIEISTIGGNCSVDAEKAVVQLEGKTYSALAAHASHLQVECILHSTMK